MSFRIALLILLLTAGLQAGALSLDHIDELVQVGRYIELRASAEGALQDNADSAEGWYALGVVFLHGEGILSRARLCLGRARDLLEAGGRDSAGQSVLYARTLEALVETAGLMDRYAEQVRLMELHDRQFGGMYEADIGWPLMKLGRVDEARRRMRAILAFGGGLAAGVAMNTLGAIDEEQDGMQAAYGWFERAFQQDPAVSVACNLAETAMATARFERAEKVLLAVTADSSGTVSNPWTSLGQLYALQGRLPEALFAIDKMRAWMADGPAWAADQRWAGQSRVAVQVMLAAGRDEEALRLTELLLDRPERNGRDSGNRERSEASTLALRLEALRVAREHLAEQAASATAWTRVGILWQRLRMSFEMWRVRRRASTLLAARGIERSLIPSGVEAPVPEWLRPPAGESFGYGVEQGARRRREHLTAERAYHWIAGGELALSKGKAVEALEAFSRAARELPAAEVLLRARLDALTGRALELQGDLSGALPRYQQALAKSPRVFRSLDMALPVSVETDGSEPSREAANMILRSPRFARRPGFHLRVLKSGDVWKAWLGAPDGALLGEAQSEDPRALCRAFHDAVFTPRLDLSQLDSKSLDGSNSTVQLTGDAPVPRR